MNSEKSFSECWAFASEIKDELGACACYDIAQYPGTFKTGRPRWMCTYYDVNRRVVARRIGMSLTSRKNVEYKVFSREEWVERPILRREQTNDAYADDQAA